MKRLKHPASLIGCLFLIAVLGGPTVQMVTARQSGQSVDISIVVLPPVEPTPNSPANPDAPMVPDPGARELTIGGEGTVTTTLSFAEPLPASYDADGFMLSLLVDDERMESGGWDMNVMQAPESAQDHALWLHHFPYPNSVQAIKGQRTIGGAPVNQLSIGQPLVRMTLVSFAGSDYAPGVYGFQFVVACDVQSLPSGMPLVLSLTAAP